MRAVKLVVMCAISFVMVGCANWKNTVDIMKGDSLLVDIQQRGVFVKPPTRTVRKTKDGEWDVEVTSYDNGMIVCAEPSPDAMSSYAMNLAAKGNVPEKAAAEVALALQNSAAFTGIRTQNIQLLRDFSYRLCEAHMSGAIDKYQYDLLMRRLQKNTVALLAIEQLTGAISAPPIALTAQGSATVAKSLTDMLDRREKLANDLSTLDTEKSEEAKKKKTKEDDLKKKEEEKSVEDKKDPKPDTAKLAKEIEDIKSKIATHDAKIAELGNKITRLNEVKDTLDKVIADPLGLSATGKTEATINTGTAPAKWSDASMLKIAEVVKDITTEIVLSDDIAQVCLGILQTEGINKKKDLRVFCETEVSKRHAVYLQLKQIEVEDTRISSEEEKITKKRKELEVQNDKASEEKAAQLDEKLKWLKKQKEDLDKKKDSLEKDKGKTVYINPPKDETM